MAQTARTNAVTLTSTLAAAALAGGVGLAIGVLGVRPPVPRAGGETTAVPAGATEVGATEVGAVEADPELLAKYRQAYRDVLRETGPAGMVQVLEASDARTAAGPEGAGPPAWAGAVMARVGDEGEPGAGGPRARLGVPEAASLPGLRVVPASGTGGGSAEGWAAMRSVGGPRATIREVSLTTRARPQVGTHEARVEGRLVLPLPPAVRRQLGNPDEVMLTPDAAGCLRLAVPDTPPVVPAFWNGTDGDGGREGKRLLARAARVALDSEGRVEVSPALAEGAGLKGNVVLVGGGDHFEVWDAARWGAREATSPAASPAPRD